MTSRNRTLKTYYRMYVTIQEKMYNLLDEASATYWRDYPKNQEYQSLHDEVMMSMAVASETLIDIMRILNELEEKKE